MTISLALFIDLKFLIKIKKKFRFLLDFFIEFLMEFLVIVVLTSRTLYQYIF